MDSVKCHTELIEQIASLYGIPKDREARLIIAIDEEVQRVEAEFQRHGIAPLGPEQNLEDEGDSQNSDSDDQDQIPRPIPDGPLTPSASFDSPSVNRSGRATPNAPSLRTRLSFLANRLSNAGVGIIGPENAAYGVGPTMTNGPPTPDERGVYTPVISVVNFDDGSSEVDDEAVPGQPRRGPGGVRIMAIRGGEQARKSASHTRMAHKEVDEKTAYDGEHMVDSHRSFRALPPFRISS
jgi:hypothetical protein